MQQTERPPRNHLDLLFQASLEFNSTLDPDALLSRVFDRVVEILEAEAGSVWLREGDTVVCRIARGPVAEQIEGLELPLGAGIVGDVARRGESELVADAREDPRFVHQVDEATGFTTRSVVSVPLKAKGHVLGVLQVLNKRSGSGLFDEADLALLEGLASTAGLALRNAQLHDAEKRAHDLAALLGISREITSTLDTDRLAVSVVNLASQTLAYDRAAIALEEGGRFVLRAISGQETVDVGSEDTRTLERLIAWLAERDELVYLPDFSVGEDGIGADLRSVFGDHLEGRGVRSLCLIPLKDEEGRLGAFYMESGRPDFLGETGHEAAELLANQVSVAVRNADLYGQVPFIGLLEPLAAWRRRLAAMPRRALIRRYGIPALVVIGLISIPWAERITPSDVQLLPADRMPVRATVRGLLTEIRVSEGDEVEKDQVMAVLRDDELRMELQEVRSSLMAAERRAAVARARGDEPGAQLAQVEARELSARMELLNDQLERTRLQAPVGGVVLTLRPYEMLGEWLEAGETFVVLGRTGQLELEARAAQRDIERVRVGQRVRLKVPAQPNHIFVGRVTEIAPSADAAPGGEPTFVVRAGLDNGQGLLKPGMEARAKIVGARRPIGYLLARPLVRWIRLRFWR
ncbi:MAG: GAF domain-containing protein [Gemmatimonadota bacterium]